jgi:hypothetical protein
MQILALCCVQGGPQRLVFMRQCGRYKAVLFIMQVFQMGGSRGDSSACLAIAIENTIVFLNKSLRKRILGFYFLCGFLSLFWGACLYFLKYQIKQMDGVLIGPYPTFFKGVDAIMVTPLSLLLYLHESSESTSIDKL